MSSDILSAVLSMDAYFRGDDGSARLQVDEDLGIFIHEITSDFSSDGFSGSLYLGNGNYIVAFRGTNIPEGLLNAAVSFRDLIFRVSQVAERGKSPSAIQVANRSQNRENQRNSATLMKT